MRLAALLACVSLAAAPRVTVQPRCLAAFYFTGAAVRQLADNTGAGCVNWTIGYSSSGFTGLTLSVQIAPDAGNVPGTWVDWTGTVVSGLQPNTSTAQASTELSGYFRWVRVSLSGLTGSGIVAGMLYGSPGVPCTVELLAPRGLPDRGSSPAPAPQVALVPERRRWRV